MAQSKSFTYEVLPVSQLKINEYQRVLGVNFAKSIGRDFKPSEVGLITVSQRGGSYNVVDGQHRVYGAKMAKVETLMCLIHHNLTYQEEAALFIKLNKNRKSPLALDYFNAALEAEEEQAVKTSKILEKHGLVFSKGTGTNTIQAITSVSGIYDKYGPEHLDNVLRLIKATWDGETGSLNKMMLQGVAAFLSHYGLDINERMFVKQLKKVDPAKILREAEADTSNVIRSIKIVNVLFRNYNNKLTKNRLENKHFAH